MGPDTAVYLTAEHVVSIRRLTSAAFAVSPSVFARAVVAATDQAQATVTRHIPHGERSDVVVTIQEDPEIDGGIIIRAEACWAEAPLTDPEP